MLDLANERGDCEDSLISDDVQTTSLDNEDRIFFEPSKLAQ